MAAEEGSIPAIVGGHNQLPDRQSGGHIGLGSETGELPYEASSVEWFLELFRAVEPQWTHL